MQPPMRPALGNTHKLQKGAQRDNTEYSGRVRFGPCFAKLCVWMSVRVGNGHVTCCRRRPLGMPGPQLENN